MGHESKSKQRMFGVVFCFTQTASRLNKNVLRKRRPPEDRERNGVILRLASEEIRSGVLAKNSTIGFRPSFLQGF
jgi:hypothetical protein